MVAPCRLTPIAQDGRPCGKSLGRSWGFAAMVQRVATVAFEGIEVHPVDVQVQVVPGMVAFTLA